jgi:hypothetical protein
VVPCLASSVAPGTGCLLLHPAQPVAIERCHQFPLLRFCIGAHPQKHHHAQRQLSAMPDAVEDSLHYSLRRPCGVAGAEDHRFGSLEIQTDSLVDDEQPHRQIWGSLTNERPVGSSEVVEPGAQHGFFQAGGLVIAQLIGLNLLIGEKESVGGEVEETRAARLLDQLIPTFGNNATKGEAEPCYRLESPAAIWNYNNLQGTGRIC